MGATRRRIHLCGANRPVLLSLIHLFLDRLVAVHRVLAQVLHIHTQRLVLANLQPALRPATWIDQQVLHLFVIDFDHGELDLVRLGRIALSADALEDLRAGDRNYTDVRTIANLLGRSRRQMSKIEA